MKDLHFEWDKRKSIENERKHNVSFEEAQTVFYDDNAREFFDPDHSDDEDQFLMLGISARMRVLVVCHCHRQGKNIRIISARKADNEEEKDYWEIIT
jgi:uncharacterized DUF497 family protein